MRPQIELTVLTILIICNLFLIEVKGYTPLARGCDQRSCYPATGNLLIGRQDKLTANSTCGSGRRERYCVLSLLDNTSPSNSRQNCFWCDSTEQGTYSNPRTSHNINNIVYRMGRDQGGNSFPTWWQARNGEEYVTIQLDLEAEFHVTHLIMTFKTFRPAAMYIEKSYDWGTTWKIHRYFAADCESSFPGVPVGVPKYLNETVCQTRYSRQIPSTKGSVIYRVLPSNVNIRSPGFNPYSQEVQTLLKTTNMRIHMTRLHSLGDENLLSDIKEKYYYAIYDMTIRGSCSCYGHAERCLPDKEEHANIPGMVHGRCDCTHNTKGNNCEFCQDDFNDVPWRPATGKKKNECKKCNCHNHATKCVFNPVLYAATGEVSGGVCSNCQHNTDGHHCEYCIFGYYQDPNLDLTHPDICKPCDCEPEGTIDDGVCDGRTDEREQTVAGMCHCKRFIDGPRCDHCKTGYWNFTASNPYGCQECTCYMDGTIAGEGGCDQQTGHCTCKRNVIGRDCDQCYPQHFGLSAADPEGCKPCDCDVGGSYDNDCDVQTGQCRCRPHISGRRCDQIDDGYFTGPLNYLLFEGETAHGTVNPPTQVIKKEQNPGGNDWSGFGFMKAFEGSELTFHVPGIFKGMEYDLMTRHKNTPSHLSDWADVKISVIPLDGPPDPNGPCANKPVDAEIIRQPLFAQSGSTPTPTPLCLEEGKRYEIKYLFDQYDTNNPDPKANILIDSIALIPRTDEVDIFQGSPLAETAASEFERNRCRERFMMQRPNEEIMEPCKSLLNSISYYVFNGGSNKQCECDSTGSESTLCDKYTGQCPCKKSVVGRKCDQCAPGTFDFGADGCQPCFCHNIGSLDPFCRQSDGQCNCDERAYGRRCNECQPGYWNFPNCQPCECNLHADTCDSQTGECINCRDATAGFHCEHCAPSYYLDLRADVNKRCRECPCPFSKASGHSFAESCYLDASSGEPICECDVGYSGTRCKSCDDNYFGSPELPTGSCVPCNCSNNWNFEDTGNCDTTTGQCLKCLFNTEGFECEHCKPGFFGDAVNNTCQECQCDILGSDPDKFDCDRSTGLCNCLPNVIGDHCDRCEEDHWKIGSGEGCESCDCDPFGSSSKTCNVYTGQCECRPGFGGRRCDQCEENYWGNPQVECFPCNCNPQGSQSYQCDHATGKCICLEGIGGEKCDECAIGFFQETHLSPESPVHSRTISYSDSPRCRECGECFTNWNRILTDLSNKTKEKVAKAEMVKVTGVTGAYTRAFEDMEGKLGQVKDILRSASVSNDELLGVHREIDGIDAALKSTTDKLDTLDNDLAVTKQSIFQDKTNLDILRSEADQLKLDASEMKDQTTRLQEANVEGALNLTRMAKSKSDEAAANVRQINLPGGDLFASQSRRKDTETVIQTSGQYFAETQTQNQETLQNIIQQISNLENKIPDLNKQICDGETSKEKECDNLCGGAGCNQCGGLSCLNGAVTMAGTAVKSAEDADAILIEKDREAEQVLRDATKADLNTQRAANAAQVAYDRANEARNRSAGEMTRINELLEKIKEFTEGEKATPEDVKKLANECLAAEMSLDASEIQNLAGQINEAISSVTNVDQILQETEEDLLKAQSLQVRADDTRVRAASQLEEATRVTSSLSNAVEDQNKADIAIQEASEDIIAARSDLEKISDQMETAVGSADASFNGVSELAERQKNLQTVFIQNENHVNSAQNAAIQAKNQADSANAELYQLNKGFKNVSESLRGKMNTIGISKDKAIDLQRRASELSTSASSKLGNLLDVEKEFERNEETLTQLNAELIRLNCEMMIHLQVVESKSKYYRNCSPPEEWSPSSSCQCLPGQSEPTCTSRREAPTLYNQ
ncbi:laminin subunit beta-1 isoform X1 [Lepeophtheirus salmonis]|uniref:laminin subunit beta-1 isoform X1 n=2 Tax=Lepeophtheirus salmonis TaxID=72036 RepID=UPI001AE69768|nr:laminin subunit beta-1-like [Lepeophtheirus salmonis]